MTTSPMQSANARFLFLSAAVLSCVAAFATGNAISVDVGIPGRANAYPSLADAGPLVAVAWGASTSDGTTDIYTALSRDGGHSFAEPVRVSDGAGTARLAGEQPPRIVLVPQSCQRAVDRGCVDRKGGRRHETRLGAL